MNRVRITIDGREIRAEPGQMLLWAAEQAGIFIPQLCARESAHPAEASCRLCWVDLAGSLEPVLSCTVPVQEGLVVSTRSPAVDRMLRSAFELLLSRHRLHCKTCPANGACALQRIGVQRKIPLRLKRFPFLDPDWPIDESRPQLCLDPNRCVLCGQCVYVCNHEVGKGILDFQQRGLETRVGTFDGEPLASHDCDGCTRCAEVCPVGALYRREPAS